MPYTTPDGRYYTHPNARLKSSEKDMSAGKIADSQFDPEIKNPDSQMEHVPKVDARPMEKQVYKMPSLDTGSDGADVI